MPGFLALLPSTGPGPGRSVPAIGAGRRRRASGRPRCQPRGNRCRQSAWRATPAGQPTGQSPAGAPARRARRPRSRPTPRPPAPNWPAPPPPAAPNRQPARSRSAPADTRHPTARRGPAGPSGTSRDPASRAVQPGVGLRRTRPRLTSGSPPPSDPSPAPQALARPTAAPVVPRSGLPCARMDLGGQWLAAESNDDLRRAFADTGFRRLRLGSTRRPRSLAVASGLRRHPTARSCTAGASPAIHLRPDRRTFLTFDGIFYQGDVWLDGEYLGDTEGYFFPHTFEVTAACAARSDHVLAVEVACSRPSDLRGQTQPDGRLPALGLHRPGLEPGRNLGAGADRRNRARCASGRSRCCAGTPPRTPPPWISRPNSTP